MASEAEEFEFRARAEKEAAAPISSAPQQGTGFPSGSPESLKKIRSETIGKNRQQLDEYAKSLGLDGSVPTPEYQAIEEAKKRLYDSEHASPSEFLGEVAGSAGMSGALSVIAPSLLKYGGEAAAQSGLPMAAPIGRGASTLGTILQAQPTWSRAGEGAAVGAVSELAKGATKELGGGEKAQTVAEFAAPGVVTPIKGVGQKVVGASEKSARQVFRDLVDRIGQTPIGRENTITKIVEKLKSGASLDEVAQGMKKLLGDTATKIEKGGEVKAEREFEAGASEAARLAEQNLQAKIDQEQSRLRTLGPEVQSSDIGDSMRSLAMQRKNAADTSLKAGRDMNLGSVEATAQTRSARGEHVADETEGAAVLNKLDALLKPNAHGQGQLTGEAKREVEKIYADLAGAEAQSGQASIFANGKAVAKPPKAPARPALRNLVNEIKAAGGIDPGELRELGAQTKNRPGLFRKGGMSGDKLLEFAQQHGWIEQSEIDEMEAAKPGGAAEKVKEHIRRILNKEDVVHPSETDAYMEFQQHGKDWENQYGESAKAYAASEAAYKAGTQLRDPTRLPQSFAVWDEVRRRLRETEKGSPDGYKSIGGQRAREIADGIDKALEQYAPGFKSKYLKDYSEGLGKLGEFDTPLGKVLSGVLKTDKLAPSSDAEDIAGRVFSSRDSFIEGRRLLGASQQQMDNFAVLHANAELKNKTGAEAQAWLDKQGWLPEISPDIKAKIETNIKQTRMFDQIKKSTGQGAWQKAIGEGEKKAASVTAEAKAKADSLRGSKNAIPILEDMITSRSSEANTKEMLTALSSSPEGKKLFEQAVRGLLAKRAMPEPGKFSSIGDSWHNVEQAMLATGLYNPKHVAEIGGLVKDLDAAVQHAVITKGDVNEAVAEKVTKQWKGYAIAGIAAAAGAHAAGLPVSQLSLGAEAVGAAGFAGGYQRYKNSLISNVNKIVASPELQALALAENNPGNVRKLTLALAKMAGQGASGGISTEVADAAGSRLSGRKQLHDQVAAEQMPIEKREKGGPVQPGKPYLVGEKGPEVIVPGAGGQVIPTNRLQNALGLTGMPTQGFKMNGLNPDGSYGQQPVAQPPQGQGNTGQNSKMVADYIARTARAKHDQGVQMLVKRGIAPAQAEQMITASEHK